MDYAKKPSHATVPLIGGGGGGGAANRGADTKDAGSQTLKKI